MKNTNKSFFQSVRHYFREGMILYAASTARYPENLDLMRLYQQAVSED